MTKKKPAKEYEAIHDTGPAFELVDSAEIAQALGATVDSEERSLGGSPYSIAVLRSRLASELTSTGGRPGRREAAAARRIPLTQSEWNTLGEITEVIRRQGVKATASQVAGVLLHQSMSEVSRLMQVAESVTVRGVARQPSGDLEETVERVLAAAASAQKDLEELRPIAEELLSRMRSARGIEADDDE